jgi:hypothetical protein
MFPFIIYFLTMVAVFSGISPYVAYSAWGAPTPPNLALVGILALFAASVVSLFRLRFGAIIALVGIVASATYYIPIIEIVSDGGEVGVLTLWITPILLLLTTAYSIMALIDENTFPLTFAGITFFPATTSKFSRFLAVPLGLIMCCAGTFLPEYIRPRDTFSIDQKADIIVYFHKTATNSEINEFHRTVVGIPLPEQGPTAHALLPEISHVTATGADNHEGVIIGTWPHVTLSERNHLVERIELSPIVFVVLRDVVPSQINTVPTPTPKIE